MKYKVLITTSGIGSRLGDLTSHTNKSLVRIGKKPVISYIIESYPKETNFVITLGYYGQHVKDFVELAYPKRKFEFVWVDKYEGDGSSLVYSMLKAKHVLQCPFIYHASDTITKESIPVPSNNWIGGFKGEDSTSYASWKVINSDTLIFNEKGAINFDYLHIGLVGVHDYKKFWSALSSVYKNDTKNTSLNDCLVIDKMIHTGDVFTIKEFTSWYDVGNTTSLHHTRNKIGDNFQNLDKLDESIFLFDKFAVKFFYDKEMIRKRVARAEVLKGLVPDMEGVRDNFYRYKYADGDLYSRVANPTNFQTFLKWSMKNLWIKNNQIDDKIFKNKCKEFYHDKTIKRIEKFLNENDIKDGEDIINGEKVPSITTLLSKVDFNSLSQSEQYKVHGDFILENIIKTKKSYCLIDWRQDFAGFIEVGDIYYDLAKLNHNLTVNHDIVNANQFVIDNNNHVITCDIMRKDMLVNCQKELELFLIENKFDVKKVKILTAIIWLNMSPLHHYPFNLFLFYFGKLNLWKILKEEQ